MTKYWKTSTETPRRKDVQWPTLGEIIRQLSLVLVIGLVWGGLFAGLTRLNSQPTTQTQLEPTATSALAVLPTDTPAPPPTDTPTPSPSLTSEPTATPEPVSTATNTQEPPSTPTETPEPTPTETPVPPTDTPQPVEESVQASFAGDVLPVLERRCLQCHGGERVENGFSTQSHETLLEGSWNGAVIVPGDAEGSYLVDLIVSGEMPKRGPRLLPAEIEKITAWIEAGAPKN